MSVHSERLEHLEKEVRCVRIYVKGIWQLMAQIIVAGSQTRPHFEMLSKQMTQVEKEAAEVFDA